MAKVIQVIEVEEKRGKGIVGDPVRCVMQYWSFDGELLAENDPVISDRPTQSIMAADQFIRDTCNRQGAVRVAGSTTGPEDQR
ncbi:MULTISPECIES: hypothetical protein [unclassified Bradyrhizobium]|uniref:hypothetical protein n=1 Tax=unclassified Bradyrhizobium TaxID=2631580 RepID=UPI0028ED6CA7|nr:MULTISPECIES: hypothetical protein [unclassified Bradyrhizobium]